MPRVSSATDDGGRTDDLWALVNSVADHRPASNAAMKNWVATIMSEGTLSARLRELLRLRIAFHNQCRSCMSVRYEPDAVGEDLVCALERPAEAPDLTESERVALRFGDLFATDHLAIDDTVFGELRAHFTEGELVELGMFCAYCVGAGRLVATWNIIEPLPKSFQSPDGPITPWGHEVVSTPLSTRSNHD